MYNGFPCILSICITLSRVKRLSVYGSSLYINPFRIEPHNLFGLYLLASSTRE